MIIIPYLDQILETQLKQYKIRYRFIEQIKEDVYNRICSMASRYQTDDLYQLLRFTVLEEAQFYRPRVDIEIRALTVAAIRNSKLEIAASVSCNTFKMPEPLTDEQIKNITQEALRYFGQFSIEEIAMECRNSQYTDVFGQGKEKYPLAVDALKKLALMEGTSDKIPKYGTSVKEPDFELFDSTNKLVICDGYTLAFDDQLIEALGLVLSGKLDCFYVDSFKMLSRNFEKILHVLEILLEKNKIFATSNYYISNGYIEKREKLLRAAHSKKDIFDNAIHAEGAPPKLREILMSNRG